MIRFESVWKTYRDQHALSGVDFNISSGEFVFLTGASGAGKSTVMRLISRELVADRGRVSLSGVDLAALSERRAIELRRIVASVPQGLHLLEGETVEGNIMFALRVAGWPRKGARERSDEMLELVGLQDKRARMPHELSGGERQRVAIARAVAGGPAILLADEPTGNLDRDTAQGIVALLTYINQAGTTVLMSTHNPEIVEDHGSRVLELDAGTLVSDVAATSNSWTAGPALADVGAL